MAVLFVGVTIIALVAYFRRARRTTARVEAAEAGAVAGGSARIVEVGSSYTSRTSGETSVAVRLAITDAAGSAYEAISVWEVQPAHLADVQVGKLVPVKVERQNPKIIFPDVPWASQSGASEFDEEDMTN